MYKLSILALISILQTDPASSQTVISADASRKLYLGLDNPISIAIQDCLCNFINVEVDQGKLIETAPCKFIYRPDSPGAVIFKVNKYGSANNNSFLFNVYSVPELNARLGKREAGEIKQEDLVTENNLHYSIAEGFIICGVPLGIDSFTFLVLRDTSIIYSEKNESGVLTDTAKRAMSNLHKGDKVLFIDIVASVSGNTISCDHSSLRLLSKHTIADLLYP